MPNYLFVTHDGDDHAIEIDLANDEVAYEEARKAFVEAARDALDENQEFTLRMTAEESSRPIFSAQFSFKIGRQG